MTDLERTRRRALSVGVSNMETVELLFLAKNIMSPAETADTVMWADCEALPLLRELGERLEVAITPTTA